MRHRSSLRAALIAVLAAGALGSFVATPVFAAPPHRDDDQHHRQARPPQRQAQPPQRQARQPQRRSSPPRAQQHRPPPQAYFSDRHRGLAHGYFAREWSGRRCPPGLARKGRSCVPIHARAWTRGRPLPAHLIYHDVPSALVLELGPPPSGHRYVRVAGDILMIAIGTGLVVDALQDIFD
jgi:Ni/Co efflux regulator RcnB